MYNRSLSSPDLIIDFIFICFRSLSVPRKWKPPTMITGNTKCMNSRNSQTSPSAISKNTIEQLTPRLRVGLTRNFKSPKPLHASLKWTP